MNLALHSTTSERPAPFPPPGALEPRTDARLQHLFRGTLGNGLIHPLYLPMLQYRTGRGDA